MHVASRDLHSEQETACFCCYLIIQKQTGLAVLEQMEPADLSLLLGT